MLNRIKAGWNIAKPIIYSLGAIFSILAFLYIFWEKLSGLWNLARRFTNPLIMHRVTLAFVVFAIFIFALYLKLHHLKKYVSMSFKEDFKKDLEKNWDYRGTWKPLPGGELSVTDSDLGGITRVGHLWTDYSFEFTAVIVNRCIAWIVRAQDLYNYYMIQLDPTHVRPHLRFAGQWAKSGRDKDALSIITNPHGQFIQTNKTIEIRTEVRGSEIRVFVNNKQIYYDQKFFSLRFINQDFVLVRPQPGAFALLPFTTGRVGFRASGREHGKFSRCRVRAL